jgi:membrane protease YdiL (CAAX protease family)
MKPEAMMQKPSVRDWLSAVFPALIWLLLRYAGKNLPPAAQIGLTAGLFVAAIIWYCREKESSSSRHCRSRKGIAVFRLSGKDILLWTGVGIACGLLNRLCFGKSADASSGVPAFLLICVLGPITEEIIYRGLVYERCLRFLPETGAILLNSLLFAVAHGSPAQMAVAFIAGLLFSFARKKTGTVTAPVIMHIIINLSVFLF